MSAPGRLWRRAPAWRLCLLSAIGLTALAAMFPPTLPALRWPGRAGRAGGTEAATFKPLPDAAPDDTKGFIGLPRPGPVRTGLIGFAGRKVPLPSGNWQTLAVVASPIGLQLLLLDRISDNRLTGLLLVTATGPFGGPAGPVGVPVECAEPDRLSGAIVPQTPGQSPLTHECWSVVPADMKLQAGRDGVPIIARGLARLGGMGVAVPDRMLAAQFVRSTDRGWQDTTVMVPDKGGPTTALSGWAVRYLALLHKGFDGTAMPADLTQAAIRDPG